MMLAMEVQLRNSICGAKILHVYVCVLGSKANSLLYHLRVL